METENFQKEMAIVLGFPVFPTNWTNPETGEESSGYRERGYYPEAFNNMLAFLGWNPGTTQELFTMKELINSSHWVGLVKLVLNLISIKQSGLTNNT